jgi:hypothetical protein
MAKRRGPSISTGVPRKRAKREEKAEREKNFVIRTIKLSANSIFKAEYAEALTDLFFKKSFAATQISYLASLLLLHIVNNAVDHNDTEFFTNKKGKNVIRDCFGAVTQENIHNPVAVKMPLEFVGMVEALNAEDQFEWPSRYQMANVFEYLWQHYETNVTTNLTTHCEKRLTYFLKMKCYQLNDDEERLIKFDDLDIRNTKNNLLFNQDST